MRRCRLVIESKYDSTEDTLKHKERVKELLEGVAEEFITRGDEHDNSKLKKDEADGFSNATKQLKDIEFGSSEYENNKKEIQPTLDLHYSRNSHHPQFFSNGINGMNLFDIVEMFFDWKASSERHKDGDLNKSLDINAETFEMNEQLVDIFKNTIEYMGY